MVWDFPQLFFIDEPAQLAREEVCHSYRKDDLRQAIDSFLVSRPPGKRLAQVGDNTVTRGETMKHALLTTFLLLASLAAVGQTIQPKECMEHTAALIPATPVKPDTSFAFEVYYSVLGCQLRIDESFPGTIRTMIFDITDSSPTLVASLSFESDKNKFLDMKKCQVVDRGELAVKQCHSRVEFEHLVETGLGLAGKP